MGESFEPVRDASIVVTDGRITEIGRDVTIPDGAQIVDLTGKTVLPGFIDAHVHIGFYEPSDVLAGGVTTVRDLAWPPERISVLVRDSQVDAWNGPTILAAGPMLTAPGGYPTRAGWAPPGTGLEVSSVPEAQVAVTSIADRGFSIVKIALNPPVGPVLGDEELHAIVDVAHRRGLKVTGHISGLDQLVRALDAGIDELAHMLMSDETVPADVTARMVAQDVAIVPTLSIFSGSGLHTAIANLRSFVRAGGRVIYGTDLGNEGPRPGIDAAEIQAMNDAGMSGLAIIRSATVDSAEWLGLDNVGVLEEGAVADLIAVDGDPLADPMVLAKVSGVWRRGVAAKG